jgi:ribosomal protein L24
MENFIAITEKAGERITYYEPGEILLRPGDRIRVNGGLYDGREGVIMRVKGKRRKQLVVSIPGVLIASVEMEPDLVELTSTLSTEASEKPAKSKDVEGDKQLVMRLAKRLLFEIPEAYQHEKEYYLLLSELNRAAFRLRSMKGYVSSQEAELALALYLAAFKLQQNQEAAEARLRKAIDRLQDTSLLKVRAQMYLAVLSKDEKLFALVQERINAIKAQKLSMKQRLLLEDFESLSSKIAF